MSLALALGRRRRGLTWPNPSVGAVLLREVGDTTTIVAQGATGRGGRPHAEPVVLTAAGDAARGATLYVSLEPCSHHGRTPPCVDAIVAAGVARVVSALEDPDPRVAGRGHAILRDAGLRLETGVCAAEAARDHRGHILRIREGRPHITVKLAWTADGYAAARAGPRLLITGEGANARTHLMRAHADAVMVGIGTVLVDDPALDVRLPGLEDRSPLRIILDSRLRLPACSRVAQSAQSRATLVVCTEDAPAAKEDRLTDIGIDVVRVQSGADGRPDLMAAMAALASRGLTHILCEGGPDLVEALARADLIDEMVLITNSRRLDAPGIFALRPTSAAAIAERMRRIVTMTIDDDRIETFERSIPCSRAS